MRTKDIAWLAGLLQLRGSIRYRPYKRDLRIVFQSTDSEVVGRVAELLGATVRPPTQSDWGARPVYATILCGRRAHGWAMTLYSLFNGERKHQLKEALCAIQSA